MWQKAPVPKQGKQGRWGMAAAQSAQTGKYRKWAVVGLIAFAIVCVAGVAGNFTSDGPGRSPSAVSTTGSPVSGETTDGESGYLDDGYAQLDEEDTADSSFSSWGLFTGIILPLLIVVGLIYAVLRGLKFFNSRVAATSSQSKLIESIDTLSLGQNGVVHLVRVGEQVMAVGAGGQGMTLLSTFDGEQAHSLITQHREQLERSVSSGNQMIDTFKGTFKDTLLKHIPHHQAESAAVDMMDMANMTETEPDVVELSSTGRATPPSTNVEPLPVPATGIAPSFAAAPAFADAELADDAHTWLPQSFDTIPPRSATAPVPVPDAPADGFAQREAQQRQAFKAMLARLNDGSMTVEDAEEFFSTHDGTDSFETVPRSSAPRFGASHP